MKFSLETLRPEYERLWATMEIRADKLKVVDNIVRRILDNKTRYLAVEAATSVPWFVIGIIHTLECGGNFRLHLHNGDPLHKKTVRVPKGRPPGEPPWTWEESAIDAIKLTGLDRHSDWSPAGIAWALEQYNGWGYRYRKINSPYLWSYSNHYSVGKFVADGKFSATAVSSQCGGMIILKRLEQSMVIPKSIVKSKIAAGAAAAGATGAGLGIDDLIHAKEAADKLGFFEFLTARRYLLAGIILLIIAVFIIYYRWKDHGRGALKFSS